MALSNRDRVGKGLELMNKGLQPFVVANLKSVFKDKWFEEATLSLREESIKSTLKTDNIWDSQALLVIMWNNWERVFKKILSQSERALVSELRDIRNKWAHQEAFSLDDTHRALDSIVRLLTAISAIEAVEVEKYRKDIMRLLYDEQNKKETKKTVSLPISGAPVGGLKPWREIVTPHKDVATGRYQQAEFAADLWQVYNSEGSDEYKDPEEFFRRTFLTEGLHKLLVDALLRLSGKGGNPVVELQTNFGGGKTHSMLALYHLFSGITASKLSGVESVIKESGADVPKKVNRAVIVGTRIAPGQPLKKKDGTLIKTLWGEIAYQLGGKEGYELVRKADETSTNPGDQLKVLFNKYSPCLILIDEWVAYARQLYNVSDLPAGTFDTHFTFAQAISEAAKNAKNTLLVVSIPASVNEIGGEGGSAALDKLKNAVSRVESSWRPASAEEGFEIVRRRLFEPITDSHLYGLRDAVVGAFGDLYRTQSQEFPPECREAGYERRLKAAYPIHPELFDRLFNDWSSLDKFQRTRGVLRLMAAVIHTLWERDDKSLLIMPSSVPIDAPAVHFELTRYLEDPWVPVIESDIDGPNSLPLQIDRDNPNLGRYSACRRVSRTIYMGSAPTMRAANRGIEDRNIKLGCAQPGESVPTFGDALRRLSDKARFLYVDGTRYWFSTQPSVTRLAEDRAQQLGDDDVNEEILRRLRNDIAIRDDFSRVNIYSGSTGDIIDEKETRLVVLGPELPHTGKDTNSAAYKAVQNILENRGSGKRIYRNALVFVAPDKTRLAELEQAVRYYLAWKSIDSDAVTLNLDAFQANQAKTKKENADKTAASRMPETFIWLLAPVQHSPKDNIAIEEKKLAGTDAIALKAAKKLRNDEMMMSKMGGIRLRMEIDKVPLWEGDHISIKKLSEYFAQYLYLPRLKNSNVMADAITDGLLLTTWEEDSFAYAERWDDKKGRYQGLKVCEGVRIDIDADGLLVKPEAAQKQIQEESQIKPFGTGQTTTGIAEPQSVGGYGQGRVTGGEQSQPAPRRAVRFYGSVNLSPLRIGSEAGKVAQEVLQHLTSLVGAEAEVSIEIQVNVPEGIPDETVRTVTENCNTLKFKAHGFEQD